MLKDKMNVMIPEGTDLDIDTAISPNLSLVLRTQELLGKAMKGDIQFSKPILEQNGKAVIFPNTINAIQGQAGVHKSRIAETICAAMLKKEGCSNDLLGFERTAADAGHTVVYVDTERNLKEQLPYALQSIQIKAGYTKDDVPGNFQYISILQVKRKDRFSALNEYLTYLRLTDPRPLFVVLDVSTDCIDDFNNTDKSLELIDLMNVAVNDHNAVFLCLIHENPKSDKARGHFGTELMNKASTAIQVRFEKDAGQNDTDLIRARYLKCRSTARHTPFHFKYCEEAKGLVMAGEGDITTAKNNRMLKAGLEDIAEHIEMYLGDGNVMSRNELLEQLAADFKTSTRTIVARLSTLLESNAQFMDNNNSLCSLHKQHSDRQVLYSLIPIDRSSE